MTGLEVVVGLLVAWATRKARRVGERLDGEVDQALEAGLDQLHDLVAAKLVGEPSVKKLQAEVEQSGTATTRTQDRVRLALEDAAEVDASFAAELQAVVRRLEVAQGRIGAIADDHGVAVGGDVRADHGGIAIGGVSGGSVSLSDRRDPHRPGRNVR